MQPVISEVEINNAVEAPILFRRLPDSVILGGTFCWNTALRPANRLAGSSRQCEVAAMTVRQFPLNELP
jgi:hypothetical protein